MCIRDRRVALVYSFYDSSEPSGENVAVRLKFDSMCAAGSDVHLVSVSMSELASSFAYKQRTAFNVATRRGVDPSRRLEALNPDIVHVHNLFPNFSSSWLERWPGPVVATLHNFRTMCANGILSRDGRDCFDCLGRYIAWPALRHRCYRSSLAATAPIVAAQLGGVARNPILRYACLLYTSRCV